MLAFLRILLVLACGLVLGWFMLVPFCYLAELVDYRACGFHAAFIWLPLSIPVGVAISWYMLSQIQRRFRSRRGQRL